MPTISIREWTALGVWSLPQDLTAANQALGSINTSAIAAANSGGLGSLDAFTFGEASISFAAIFQRPVCAARWGRST